MDSHDVPDDATPSKLPELMDALSQDEPTIPDELTRYILRTAGVDMQDERAMRLVSLNAQVFIAGVLHDSCLLWKRKRKLPTNKLKQMGLAQPAEHPILTTEDVADVLDDTGVHLNRQLLYKDPSKP
jgi:hypothetical protein